MINFDSYYDAPDFDMAIPLREMNTIKSKLVGEDFMPFRSLVWFDSKGARYDTMTEFDGINHQTVSDEEIEANQLDREDTARLFELD